MEPSLTGRIGRRAAASAAVALAAVTLPFIHAAAAAVAPQVSVDDATIVEGDAGLTALEFHVSLDAAADTSTSLHVRTAGGTATSGIDYDPVDLTVTFLPGALTATVAVPVHGDLAGERDETVGIELYDPSGVVIAPDAQPDPDPGIGLATATTSTAALASGAEGIGVPADTSPEAAADGNGIGTIVNDDPIPAVSVDDGSVIEGNSGLTAIDFHVTLSQAAKQSVSVRFRTTSGNAASGTDYEPQNLVVTFLPGALSATLPVVVHGDTTFEGDETFGVQLTNPDGVTIARSNGTGTISDDDPDPSPPAATISDAAVVEGDSGTTLLAFQVSLSETSRRPVVVTATTSDGTATSGDGDYTPTSTTVTVPAGSTGPVAVSIPIPGDTRVEPDETMTVTLSAPEWATLGDAVGTGTITNDDAEVAFEASTTSVTELGNDSTTVVELTATLSAPLPQDTTIPVSTVQGTATDGADYRGLPPRSTLVFPAGTTTGTVQVVVNGDDADEPDETFSVVLGDQTPSDRAALASATGAVAVVTIVDDDAPATTTTTVTTTTVPSDHDTTPTSGASGDPGTTGTTGSSGSSSLPRTGSSVGSLVLLGLGLVAAGFALRRFGSARRSTVG